jgi:hypothetical protein
VCLDRRAHHVVVQRQRGAHLVRMLLPETRRPRDVCEQEGHRPRRQLHHAEECRIHAKSTARMPAPGNRGHALHSGTPRRTVDPVDHDRDPELDQAPPEADGDDQDEPFERPVDRFRTSAGGTVVAAGLLGLAEALEARPPREEVVIVQEAPTQPLHESGGMELVLDPEHPERSVVHLPAPAAGHEPPDESTRRPRT